MAFTLKQFSAVRPYMYHLTARDNLQHIRELRVLYSAHQLLTESSNAPALNDKRKTLLPVKWKDRIVHIRDQSPLHRGNVSFIGGWDFNQLLRELNRQVFFWPGTSACPIDYGVRHFERYRAERPIILRLKFLDVVSRQEPYFCKFNSGSPRCTGGFGSPRGPSTFVSASEADFSPCKAVEITFRGEVALPKKLEIGDSISGPWAEMD